MFTIFLTPIFASEIKHSCKQQRDASGQENAKNKSHRASATQHGNCC